MGVWPPMSGQGGWTVRIDARGNHPPCSACCALARFAASPGAGARAGQAPELDQYDDAELVRKDRRDVRGLFHAPSPEDNLMGEGACGRRRHARWPGWSRARCRFWNRARTSSSPSGRRWRFVLEFLRTQFRAVGRRHWHHHEQLTGDLTGVNYSSIRAGMLEFRRRCEVHPHAGASAVPPGVGGLDEAGGARRALDARASRVAARPPPPVPRREVDSAGLAVGRSGEEFKAMLLAIRAGLMSRSEAISANGYDAEDVDREIAADNQRADDLGLIFDSDPRYTSRDGGGANPTVDASHEDPHPAPDRPTVSGTIPHDRVTPSGGAPVRRAAGDPSPKARRHPSVLGPRIGLMTDLGAAGLPADHVPPVRRDRSVRSPSSRSTARWCAAPRAWKPNRA